MRSTRFPALAMAILYLAFIAYTIHIAGRLPERVATHFNGSGDANGWASRAAHLKFMFIFGTALPLAVPLICFLIRYFPGSLNVPNAQFWLTPERRPETHAYLFAHSLWFGCLLLLFVLGINLLVTRANLQQPPHLGSGELIGLIIGFLVGLAWWIVTMLRHFLRKG